MLNRALVRLLKAARTLSTELARDYASEQPQSLSVRFPIFFSPLSASRTFMAFLDEEDSFNLTRVYLINRCSSGTPLNSLAGRHVAGTNWMQFKNNVSPLTGKHIPQRSCEKSKRARAPRSLATVQQLEGQAEQHREDLGEIILSLRSLPSLATSMPGLRTECTPRTVPRCFQP